MTSPVVLLGLANHRANLRPFGIRLQDRLSHLHAIGRTGTGKSTLLRVMAEQDLVHGQPFALFDPHGDLAAGVTLAAEERGVRVRVLDGSPTAPGWAFDPLGIPQGWDASLASAGLVEVFRKVWADEWGPRLEHLLRHVVLTLMASGGRLADVPQLLTDRRYREELLRRVHDPVVLGFWRGEFDRYSPGFRSVVVAPLQNKVGALLADRRLRSILNGRRSALDVGQAVERGETLIFRLPKGQMGESTSALLGSLIVSHLVLAGLSRAGQPSADRRPYFLYLDEFQTFATQMLVTLLAELRKYGMGAVLAHQYLGQLGPELEQAVLANAGTLITFRVGARDAATLARELAPVFESEDLLSLPNYHYYLKLLIDGEVSKPFSARSFGSLAEAMRSRSCASGDSV
ncbi:MAG TPA: type IV secretion system DNA-binding domain-containing protein [Thermoanaerobaculia bacterium]|nr:type IV secretion system DNA-binding domain-containing protein [Thermoanaerobaculia bacterium]